MVFYCCFFNLINVIIDNNNDRILNISFEIVVFLIIVIGFLFDNRVLMFGFVFLLIVIVVRIMFNKVNIYFIIGSIKFFLFVNLFLNRNIVIESRIIVINVLINFIVFNVVYVLLVILLMLLFKFDELNKFDIYVINFFYK